MPDNTTVPLKICLFGAFEVRLHGIHLERPRTRKTLWLLALLVLRQGHPVERDWLAATLWPDSGPVPALGNLRSSLKDLRRALGHEAARLQSPTSRTLALDLTGAAIDLHAFDAAIRRADPASLEQAVALYRGPLLEMCVEEWILRERLAREHTFLQALETLAARALAEGLPSVAEAYLRRIVSIDPFRERAQRSLMEALVATGNYPAALLNYRDLRLRLHRELNAAPDPATTALFEQIRLEARTKAGATSIARSVSGEEQRSEAAADHPPLAASGSTLLFLFTDIEGSTRLWEEHPDTMPRMLARHDALLRRAIEEEGGHVFKTVGDQFCATFATAPEALAAALVAQRSLADAVQAPHGVPFSMRVALHAGAAEKRGDDYFGPPLNRVARLLEAAHGDQILLSLTVSELLRDHLPEDVGLVDLGKHRLRDLSRSERIFQVTTGDLRAVFPPPRTLNARHHNLSVQREPLLGRTEEKAAIGRLLLREDVGIITLTGPGGTGKTRLAVQIAADLLEHFPDGTCFVDLTPVRETDRVLGAIAGALGLREISGRSLQDVVRYYLRERRLLLLLDNFEQVIAAAPIVADLLAHAPGLTVLVTSRERLRLRGEHEFAVPPLTVPDPKRLPPVSVLTQYAAVELFIQRAITARTDFAVTDENAPAVAEICVRLDGLPLAIELAAARVKLFPPRVLLSRLENRLKLLTGGARDLPVRQQTLRSTIAWSYDLLDPAEKALFERLSVFVGGCTLEAIEAVCGHPPVPEEEVFDRLTALVEKSLVLHETEGDEGRYRMLETVREYSAEILQQTEGSEWARRRHREWCLQFAREGNAALHGPEHVTWMARLEREHDNFRAALDGAEGSEEAEVAGLSLAEALGEFCAHHHLAEGLKLLERALARSAWTAPSPSRARVLDRASIMALWQGDRAAAQRLAEEAVETCQALGDRTLLAAALGQMGNAYGLEDPRRARQYHEQAIVLLREQGERRRLAWALNDLAEALRGAGEFGQAAEVNDEGLSIARQEGLQQCIGQLLTNQGSLRLLQGDTIGAAALYREGLTASSSAHFRIGVADCLAGLAGTASMDREPERAARLLGASSLVLDQIGAVPEPQNRPIFDQSRERAHAALGEEAFAAAWAEGRAMSLECALAYVLAYASDA